MFTEKSPGASATDLSIRKKNKQRFKPIAVPKEATGSGSNQVYTETVPLAKPQVIFSLYEIFLIYCSLKTDFLCRYSKNYRL